MISSRKETTLVDVLSGLLAEHSKTTYHNSPFFCYRYLLPVDAMHWHLASGTSDQHGSQSAPVLYANIVRRTTVGYGYANHTL